MRLRETPRREVRGCNRRACNAGGCLPVPVLTGFHPSGPPFARPDPQTGAGIGGLMFVRSVLAEPVKRPFSGVFFFLWKCLSPSSIGPLSRQWTM